MKRRGFTLIELMVVIAIIIILAAIAIPNYLKMTERAKRSRMASDYATLATVLETYKTDWGLYPVVSAADVSSSSAVVFKALVGNDGGATGGDLNVAGKYNSVGEQGPVSYIKTGTMTSMKNPFDTGAPVYYTSTDGKHWVIYANIGGSTANYLFRTDGKSTVSEKASTPAETD